MLIDIKTINKYIRMRLSYTINICVRREYVMKQIKNPLTIIGMFAGLAEVAGTVVLPFVEKELQGLFIWYIMGFPTLLVVLFFITLNKNPKVLYAPSDFEDESNFMKLLMDASNALTNTIGAYPSIEKDLKPVEEFIEKIPVNNENPIIISNIDGTHIIDEMQINSLPIGKLIYNRSEFSLIKERNEIGRDMDADIRIESHRISRRHCVIYRDKNDYYIKDLGSANGTFVNYTRIKEAHKLKNNDIIIIADVRLEFKL